jgi:hypothetical protein
MSAITTFAHGLRHYISLQSRSSSPAIVELDYVSFEDALWDFLDQKEIKKGSTLLIPDFFCMDVIGNIVDHGYQFDLYPVDEVFQPRFDILKEKMQSKSASVIVLFHALGIENTLVNSGLFWSTARHDQWVVEDCVHRIVEPALLSLQSPRHILIDSTRKITPFFGATLYGNRSQINYTRARHPSTSKYTYLTMWFWTQFQSLLTLGSVLKYSPYLIRAYDFLNSGDNLIGDSTLSARLPTLFSWQKRHIAAEKIKAARKNQAVIYKTLLHDLYLDHRFVLPTPYLNTLPQLQNLAFFPLPFRSDYGFLLREFLLTQGICTFIEFSDSPWAINKNVLCLPLGVHVTTRDIKFVCHQINEWHAKNYVLSH